jgi:hypothetical protein
LRHFLAYEEFDFAKPGYAVAADWLGLGSLLVFSALLAWSSWKLVKGKKAVLF